MASKSRKQPEEFDWRGLINKLEVAPLPEDGLSAPSEDPEVDETEDVESRSGRYTRLLFEVNLFTLDSNDKCFVILSKQRMFDFGAMTLGDAIKKSKEKH